jgi:hypothetical protein
MVGIFDQHEDAKHQDHGEDYPNSHFGAQTAINGIGEQSLQKTLNHICLLVTSKLAENPRIACERQMTFIMVKVS